LRSSVKDPDPAAIVLAPGTRVLLLARQIGDEAVVRWCADLLSGAGTHGDRRRPSITWLGGRHGATEPYQDYWPRVWAARALLYVWRPHAEPAVLAGLRDPAWRVREMCAKVARRHGLTAAEPILAHLLDDRVSRVRAAAEAALTASARSLE
jgi:HEAT repeat protein